VACRLHEPGLAQQLQVVRDRRLGEVEGGVQVADAALARGEPVDDRDPRRVGERLEARRQALGIGGIERLRRRAAAENG